jgi:hypothetical protein
MAAWGRVAMTTLRGGTPLEAGLAVTGLPGRRHSWTFFEHDVAVLALYEYCDTLGLGYPVAYAHEL